MDITKRIKILERVYQIYDDFTGSLNLACRQGCAPCCTCNVTLTTLEAYHLVSHMQKNSRTDLWPRIEAAGDQKRFLPRLTTNGIAELCIADRELPEEENDAAWGVCPLLSAEACPVYAARPFGCRCMVSARDCRETGWADMAPFTVTVNNLFLQFIEHVDARGISGNLIDLLGLLRSERQRTRYLANRLQTGLDGVVANRPVKALLIPPEHLAEIQPILQALQKI